MASSRISCTQSTYWLSLRANSQWSHTADNEHLSQQSHLGAVTTARRVFSITLTNETAAMLCTKEIPVKGVVLLETEMLVYVFVHCWPGGTRPLILARYSHFVLAIHLRVYVLIYLFIALYLFSHCRERLPRTTELNWNHLLGLKLSRWLSNFSFSCWNVIFSSSRWFRHAYVISIY